MLKIALIDDEEHARVNLRSCIRRYMPECMIVGEADSVQSGLTLLQEVMPDVLCLDIQMMDGDGFDLLDRLVPVHFHVVFTTAFPDYGAKAFKYHALNYLLKPIDPHELQATLHNAAEIISERQTKWGMGQKNQPTLTLSNSEGMFIIGLDEIERVQAFRNYSTFHLIDGRAITVSKALASYDPFMGDHGFFRCHQSHLVNLAHVHHWRRAQKNLLVTTTGNTVPLSKRKREIFRRMVLDINLQARFLFAEADRRGESEDR